jgi:transcriptional regulator with XRE-family HTH domain
MNFKENLKAELSYNDMLVKELAARSGVSKRTIDNYLRENGSIPNAEAAVKIARVLGVSVEYLVTGKENAVEKTIIALPPELRRLIDTAAKLSLKNRRLVLRLIKAVKEQEDEKPGFLPSGG